MSHKSYRTLTIILTILIATTAGFAMFRLTGRYIPVDFIRTFLAVIAMGGASFLLFLNKNRALALFTWFVLSMPVVCIIMLMWRYYVSINSSFSIDDAFAIGQSNLEEVLDFLEHYIVNLSSLGILILVVIFYIAQAYCCIHAFKVEKDSIDQIKGASYTNQIRNSKNYFKINRFIVGNKRISALISSFLMICFSFVLYTQFRPISLYYKQIITVRQNLATFNELVAQLNDKSSTFAAVKENKGELYVLVIGESLTRDYLGLYNQAFDNSPFLNKLVQQGNTIVFPNAYSSFVNTVPSITASFSQGNIQTGLNFPYGSNILSIAKQADINTYWVSNQPKNGKFDTPIGAISSLADYSLFTTDMFIDGEYTQKPDEILIEPINNVLEKMDRQQNNLLIIHLMGCHTPYKNRYPENFESIQVNHPELTGCQDLDIEYKDYENVVSEHQAYLTSIKYNDTVLKKITNLVQEQPDFQAMIYYSDHGESNLPDTRPEPTLTSGGSLARHNVAQFSYVMTRIPLIINYSESFKKRYPQTIQALYNNQQKVFTNDTLYDLLLDLMQVKSEAVNYSLSIASKQYLRPEPSQLELLNHVKVGNDPDFIAFQNAYITNADRVVINNAEPLFKAGHVVNKGYSKLGIEVVFKNEQLYVRASDTFSSSFFTLSEFIQKLKILPQYPELLVHVDDSFIAKLDDVQKKATKQRISVLLQEAKALIETTLFVSVKNTELLNYLEKERNNSKIKLIWQVSKDELIQTSSISAGVDYIQSNAELAKTIEPKLLGNRKLIIASNNLSVIEKDFESKFNKLLEETNASMVLVNYKTPWN